MSFGIKRKHPASRNTSQKTIKKPKLSASQRAVVRGDDLKWEASLLPKHLDDAEGFFGLEEIDDVEVVRDTNGRGVHFRAASDQLNSRQDKDIQTEEWAGFGDDDVEETELAQTTSQLVEGNEIAGAVQAVPPKAERLTKARQDQEVKGLGNSKIDFTALRDRDEKSGADISQWLDVGLSPEALSALSQLGYTSPTPIQQSAIPHIIQGQDVIGKAVTGSGKTLAFSIPIVEKWAELQNSTSKPQNARPIALILAPTRELAHQLSKHISDFCENFQPRPRLATITGGLSVQKQQRQLSNVDIVIGTPGRLWEVMGQSVDLADKLKQISFLVLDEADRLLSEGHFKELEEILDLLDREEINEEEEQTDKDDKGIEKSVRQTLIFSATFHKGLQQKLASRKKVKTNLQMNNDLADSVQNMEYLMQRLNFQAGKQPTFVDANPDSQLAQNLTETILECGAMQKDLYLYGFLLNEQHERMQRTDGLSNDANNQTARILVFTNSISSVKRLVPLLQNLNLPKTSISPLHSNMPQKARLRSLERFSGSTSPKQDTQTSVLIATDVAARGLDIKGITTIVHYHVPRTADTYVHRSGRTARIQSSGSSILLCSPEEIAAVTKLIGQIHKTSSRAKFDSRKAIDRMYLSPDLIRRVESRVDLAQKITDSLQATDKVHNEDNWLRNAADDLGVEYDSEEFEEAGRRGRRGRGGGKERKQKKAAEQENKAAKLAEWKAKLKDDLQKRVDFGDGVRQNMKYLAGGAVDVDKLLRERGH